MQEFQSRGVIHYHLLCERDLSAERATVAWCRVIGALNDPDALRNGVRVDRIENERATRLYVGRYVGKKRQKCLPPGVEAAGRWWGRSRGLELAILEEVVSREAGGGMVYRENLKIIRCVRRYLSRVFGWKFRGGAFVSWGGELTGKLRRAVQELRAFYGEPVEQGGGR